MVLKTLVFKINKGFLCTRNTICSTSLKLVQLNMVCQEKIWDAILRPRWRIIFAEGHNKAKDRDVNRLSIWIGLVDIGIRDDGMAFPSPRLSGWDYSGSGWIFRRHRGDGRARAFTRWPGSGAFDLPGAYSAYWSSPTTLSRTGW